MEVFLREEEEAVVVGWGLRGDVRGAAEGKGTSSTSGGSAGRGGGVLLGGGGGGGGGSSGVWRWRRRAMPRALVSGEGEHMRVAEEEEEGAGEGSKRERLGEGALGIIGESCHSPDVKVSLGKMKKAISHEYTKHALH